MALPYLRDEEGKDIVFTYISDLATRPNDNPKNPLSDEQFKAKFDMAGNELISFLNNLLIPAIERDIAAAAEGIGGGGQISGEKIEDGAISAAKLAVAAVRTSAMADAAVTTAKMADGATASPKIADGAVTTAKMAKGAVTYDILADESVSANKIFPGAIITQKIAEGAVTGNKIAKGAVSEVFHASVPVGAWEESNGANIADVAVSGILDTDTVGYVDVDMSGVADEDLDAAQAIDEAWGNVIRVKIPSSGTLRFFAKEKPEVDIPVAATVIRK